MAVAIVSDIHANIEALTKVEEDISGHSVSEIICLGDVIGYGPDPVACLKRVIENQWQCILGNHDQAALFDPDGFNPVALEAVYWTRRQLEEDDDAEKLFGFLGERPRSLSIGSTLYVHGSPREPTNEYVFPEDCYNQRKMDALFSRMGEHDFCFCGHSHIPQIHRNSGAPITPDQDASPQFTYIRQGNEKILSNVGAVGQPRDHDPRARWVLFDEGKGLIEYHWVNYPFQETADKIFAIPELDDMLGTRLIAGR